MQQVDKGAIRFVLSGANIMCPGLTSPGAMMSEVPKDTIVVRICFYYNQLISCIFFHKYYIDILYYQAVMAEGKEHALAIGKTTMSTDDM